MVWGRVLPGIGCALMPFMMIGCSAQMIDDSNIKAMAASWPKYRVPALAAKDQLNVWPQKQSKQVVLRERGAPPQLDRPLPVITSYRYWNLEQTAIDSLVRIGEPAVPELIKALRHGDPQVRFQAAVVLGRIGPDAEGAVPPLITTLNDTQPPVRKAAARALGQIGPNAAEAVQPLMRIINKSGSTRPAIPNQTP